jgi:hypothetical protein
MLTRASGKEKQKVESRRKRDPDILYLDWIQTINLNDGDYRLMINGFLNPIE